MSSPTAPRVDRSWPWVALSFGMIGVSGAIILQRLWTFGDYLPDDSYITYRFALHLAQGHGLVWNIGGEAVEGYTSPLHVVLLAIAFKTGLAFQTSATLINILSVAGLAATFLVLLRDLAGKISAIPLFFLCIYLTDARLSRVHLNAGLDTPLFMFLLALTFWAGARFVRAPSVPLATGLALLNIASLLARPDAAPYLLGQVVVLTIVAASRKIRHDDPSVLRCALIAYGLCLVLGCSYLAWKYAYFGYLLPNPYYVKADTPHSLPGTGHVVFFLRHLTLRYGLFFALLLPFLDYRALLRWWRQPDSRAVFALLLLPPALFLLYYTTVVHAVCFAFRFEYPALFFFCFTLAWLASVGGPERRMRNVLSRLFRREAVVSLLVLLGGAGAVGAAFFAAATKDRHLEQNLFEPMIVRHYEPVADALRRTRLGSKAVLVFDSVGYIPFMSGFNTIDPIGLTDNTLSGRDTIGLLAREEYIWGQHPDVYLGPTPPATAGARNAGEDPRIDSRYVQSVFLGDAMFAEYRRIYAERSVTERRQALHFRMRELRDRWRFLGEIPYPFPEPAEYTHLVHVRKESPHFEILVEELEPLVFRRPDEIDFEDPLRNAKRWTD